MDPSLPFRVVATSPLSTKLVLILGLLLILQGVNQIITITFSKPTRESFLTGLSALGTSGHPPRPSQTHTEAASAASESSEEPSILESNDTMNTTVDLGWYAPNATVINDISSAINGTGVYGFIYNNSYPTDVPYGTYDWCNMPHVRASEYQQVAEEYTLEYVEVIHRHHKRTVYASNSFPVESYPWNCNDEGLFFYGQPLSSTGNVNHSAPAYWQGYTSPINPFIVSGFQGTCQFPQITKQGLDDSFQHGHDLYEVYGDLLGLLPKDVDETVSFRVTQNVITSEVAGMVISGMWGTSQDVPLLIQASGIDSLEPTYTCVASTTLFDDIESTSTWTNHLTLSSPLYATLDDISGVSPTDAGFHASMDHYYDNLSARQCHSFPLPCKLVNGTNSTTCVTQDEADEVYRLGNWEYSYIYRDNSDSLAASAGSYGVWVAELAQHLRDRVSGANEVVYRHNVAHDGSLSRLLSVLQIDVMVWPGMGAEVVFEMYSKSSGSSKVRRESTKDNFVRVLFGGQVLQSSNPTLGVMDLLSLDTLLAYFDGLVGEKASLVEGLCSS